MLLNAKRVLAAAIIGGSAFLSCMPTHSAAITDNQIDFIATHRSRWCFSMDEAVRDNAHFAVTDLDSHG